MEAVGESEIIVKQFAKYCASCNGMCCKRDVFSLFGWEMKRLSAKYKNLHIDSAVEKRGTASDISICGKCLFSEKNGCKLPIDYRPLDCLTYPFYPKAQVEEGKLRLESVVIHKDCTYCNEISKDEELKYHIIKFWESKIQKITPHELTDWIGNEGQWNEWYKNVIELNTENKLNGCS